MTDEHTNLEQELATYQRLLPTLIGDEGKFALIGGEDLLGTFDTYPDALKAGYAARGLEPFLVKKIATVESVCYFSRDVRPACHTSAAM